MAYGDANTAATSAADGGGFTYVYAPKTAQQNTFVADYPNEDALHRDDQARALAAGVTSVDKIDYELALDNYQSRSDVELFVNRRAREYATDYRAQGFARQRVDVAHPLQSSTVGSTTVVEGDTYADSADAGTGDDVTSPAPDRT